MGVIGIKTELCTYSNSIHENYFMNILCFSQLTTNCIYWSNQTTETNHTHKKKGIRAASGVCRREMRLHQCTRIQSSSLQAQLLIAALSSFLELGEYAAFLFFSVVRYHHGSHGSDNGVFVWGYTFNCGGSVVFRVRATPRTRSKVRNDAKENSERRQY